MAKMKIWNEEKQEWEDSCFIEKSAGSTITDISDIPANVLEQMSEHFRINSNQKNFKIGSIWISENNEDPHEVLGIGTWQRITDKYLWAINDNESVGDLGGSETSLVNIDWYHNHSQNPHGHTENSHNHNFTTLPLAFAEVDTPPATGQGVINPAHNVASTTRGSKTSLLVNQKVTVSSTATINNTTATNNVTGSRTNSMQTIDTKQPKYGVYMWRRIL